MAREVWKQRWPTKPYQICVQLGRIGLKGKSQDMARSLQSANATYMWVFPRFSWHKSFGDHWDCPICYQRNFLNVSEIQLLIKHLVIPLPRRNKKTFITHRSIYLGARMYSFFSVTELASEILHYWIPFAPNERFATAFFKRASLEETSVPTQPDFHTPSKNFRRRGLRQKKAKERKSISLNSPLF